MFEPFENFILIMGELLGSIRDLNRRLAELKWVVRKGLVTKDARKQVLDRVSALMNTRMCLIYSIYDIRQKFIDQLKEGTPDIKEKFSLKNLFQELKDI